MTMLVALALAFLLGAATVALAAPPSITTLLPADGSRFTGAFTVTFSASDPNGINGAGAAVTLGGNTYRPAVQYSGYWDGDGCDSWWVEDRTGASFTCTVSDPGPGTHVATVAVPDALGEVSTRTLTIVRTAALIFSQQSPSPGGRYAAADDLLVLVSGPSAASAIAAVTVDGVAVPAVCESVSAGVAMVRAQHAFSSGSHTVGVSVGDGTSAPPAMTSWTFSVSASASPPSIGPSQPAEGTVVQGPFQLRYHVTDANTVNGASARVSVGGKVYSGSVSYPGYWDGDACDTWWVEDRTQADFVFSIPDLPPGSQALRFEVADGAGDWAVKKTTLLRSAALSAFGHAPAAASRNTSVDAVSVSLTGETVASSSVAMTIDGVPVPAAFTPSPDGGIVSYAAAIAEGAHTARVSASDVLGSPAMTSEWTFVVDSSAPVVASVSPSADSTMTLADAGIAVRLNDADAIAPESVRLTVNGNVVATTLQADGTGAWVRWAGVLAEGPHTAQLTARDLAGNEVVYAWAFAVADPPRVGALFPSSAVVAEDTMVTAEVSDVNAELDTAVSLTVDGAALDAALVPTGVRRGRIEAAASDLSNGTHEAVVTVRDVAGNEASKAWTFTVDALGPSLQSRSPVAGAVLGNHVVSVTGRFTDASSIDPATGVLTLDGVASNFYSANETRWEGEGCDAYEVVVPETLLLGGTYALHDGPHTLSMRAVDKFGHETTEEWSFTVREYPKIASVSPSSGTHTKESSVTVSANVTDFDGIASTAVSWRQAGEGDEAWQTVPSTYDTATGVLSARFAFPNGETGYEFRFAAEDSGGLTSTATTALYVDAAGPVVDAGSIAPASGAVLTNHTVSFGGRFTDSSNMAPAATRAWIDGQPAPVGAAYETRWVGEGCDAYEEELPDRLLFSGSAQLRDGAHTLRVQVADVFGFQTTHEWSFTVKEAPKITQITPAASSRTTENHVVASAKVTDFDGVADTAISWREANFGRPAGEWQTAETTYDPETGLLRTDFAFPRNDTRYEFRVTATDSGGLTTTATTSVFAASSAAQVQAGTDCITCHTTALQTHEIENCYACHSNAGGPCDCHGVGVHPRSYLDAVALYDHNGDYVGRTCTDCHRHEEDLETQRHASGLASSCVGCHEQALTAEHAGVLVDGQAFTCSTCHESADATVAAAIEAGDTSCAACHEMTSGHNELHKSPGLRGTVELFAGQHGGMDASMEVGCGLCHDVDDVSGIHGNACATCHPSPRDSFGEWTGSCQQGGCHPAVHANAAAGHAAEEAAESCSCHDDQMWTVTEAACGNCHALVDKVAPVTTSDALPTYIGRATIHLSASDMPSPGGSGVATTRYRVDGGAEQAGNTIEVVGQQGDASVHTVEYWSVDGAGNTETPRTASFTFSVDVVPPVTTSDAISTYVGPAAIHLTATDDSGVPPTTFYSLDGATAVQGDIVTVPQPSSGSEEHALEFWSVDGWGNEEAHTTVTFTVTADSSAPTTTCNAAPFYKYGSTATIAFSAVDPDGTPVLGTYVRLDGGAPVQTQTLSLAGLAKGAHTIEYWSVDVSGNTEAAKTITVTIDGTAPTTTSDAVAAYTGSATIRLTPADDPGGSGIAKTYYRIDNLAQQQGTQVRVFTPGSHYVRFWSVDAVGNVESMKTVSFTLSGTDTIPPVTTSDVSESYVGIATIHLTAVDNEGGSGVKSTYYRLNGGAATQGTTVLTDAKVSQVLEYWSVDNANNQESPHEVVSFSVTAPPGQGTIEFAWDAPPGAYIEYYLYDSSGQLIDSTTNTIGWWGIHVPVSPQTYALRARWYDPDIEDFFWSYGSAVINAEGEVVTWWY